MKNKLTYIIDDDKLTVKLMSILIAKKKFCENVQTFYNAELALLQLQNVIENDLEIPNAILLDINMPIMDGWQFLDEFKNLIIKKPITIFMMTSSIDPADSQRAKTYEVIKHYIEKPITTQKLDILCQLIADID